MGQREIIEPDTRFLTEVMNLGGDCLKRCFQCSNCTVVCPLSFDDNPYPRKEMLWAHWGLKERLVSDLDIWLCYQCGDCTSSCPRGARPGDALAALRNYCFSHFAFPRFMGRVFRKARYIPVLLAFPALLLIALMAATGNLSIPEGEIVFASFIPHGIVDGVFLSVSGFALFSMSISLSRLWKGVKSGHNPAAPSFMGLIRRSGLPSLMGVLRHDRFTDCGSGQDRRLSHLTIFYGGFALFFVTSAVFLGLYLFELELPLPLGSPLKLLANAGGLAVLFGCALAIHSRLTGKERYGGTYYDWNVIVTVLAVALLGFLTESARLLGVATAAYVLYFMHLVAVFYAIAYFPYSKLAHLFYRSLAVLYSDYQSRNGTRPRKG